MAITLQTIVQDGLGTVAKVIKIDTAEDYEMFQELIQRGANLWPDAPSEIKEIADMITNGKVMQNYY
jgi:hypothetical protein